MKSKIYSSDYVKTTSKGQLWIPALLAIGFLMVFPVAELMMLGNWFGMNYETAQIESLYENLWREGFMFSGFYVIAFAAFINGINGFWYLYSHRKVDFYHSLPMKRRQMFWHRTYVGILYYLIPYLIMEFLAICIGAMRGFFNLQLMKLALSMLLFHLLLYLVIYFSVVLVVCMTGNMLMGALALMGIFAYGPALGILISSYQDVFFETFYRTDYGALKILSEQGSPFLVGWHFNTQYLKGDFGGSLAVVLVVGAAMAAAAYFAYEKRRPENTGKPLIYHWSEAVIRFLVVIPVGLGTGLIFYMMPSPDSRIPWWIFGMLVGTILAHGVLEVIYQMDFRKFFSHRLQLVAAAGLVAISALVFKQDLTGYDSYLPSFDKLESMSIAFGNLGHEDIPYITPTEEGEYDTVENSWSGGLAGVDHTNVGMDKGIYQAMEKIIDAQGKNMENISYQLPMKYELKSGKVIYRQYMLHPGEIRSLLKACYEEGTLKERKYAFLQVDQKYLQWLTGTFYDGQSYTLFQDEKEKTGMLIDAITEDVREADAKTLLETPCAMLTFQYENIPVKRGAETVISGVQANSYYYSSVYVYPGFKRTVALLKETGYPMSMEEVPVENIKIKYHGADEDGNFAVSDDMIYDTKEQLDALKKCVIPEQLGGGWLTWETSLEVRMKLKDEGEELFLNLKEEELPDFVKEDMEKAKNGELEISPLAEAENAAIYIN